MAKLSKKIDDQEERLNEQPHEIAFKVKVVDVLPFGQFIIRSENKMVGAYKVHVEVQTKRIYQ